MIIIMTAIVFGSRNAEINKSTFPQKPAKEGTEASVPPEIKKRIDSNLKYLNPLPQSFR